MKERPEVIDLKRILKDVPSQGHWMWLGSGRLWARLLLFEAEKNVVLDDEHRRRVIPKCGIGTCINPEHQHLSVTILSEELTMQGITVEMINSVKSSPG